jgi:large subunit ribosomal protein L28
MSRVCEISGKKVMSGNNVSKAKNRTRRKFLPNLQNVKLFSKSLDKFINMKICVRSLKTVEKNGGLDDYLTKTSNRVLAPEALAVKNKILKHTIKKQNDS